MRRLASTVAVCYEGDLIVEALRTAFDVLCRRHPILTACIRVEDAADMLFIDDARQPQLAISTGDETDLWNAADEPWNDARGVARLIVVSGRHRGFVALRTSHAVIDGGTIFPLLSELWSIYTDIADGQPVHDVSSDELNIGPADLIGRHWKETSPVAVFHPDNSAPVPGSEDADPGVSRRVIISEQDTVRLLEVARAEQVTIGGLLAGAAVLGTSRITDQMLPARTTIAAGIDLRRYIDPPAAGTRTANLYGFAFVDVIAGQDTSAIDIARDFNRQLVHALETRNLAISGVNNPNFDNRSPVDYYQINNYGVIPPFRHPDSLRFTDFTVRPAVNMKGARFYYHRFYTFAGRINSFMTYPSRFSGAAIDAASSHFIREIGNITGTVPAVADKAFQRH
jgi:phenolphthiocerol/phthiocerol/phthiodiolone dimycocerosyl transferase